jgi:hypothetical protein
LHAGAVCETALALIARVPFARAPFVMLLSVPKLQSIVVSARGIDSARRYEHSRRVFAPNSFDHVTNLRFERRFLSRARCLFPLIVKCLEA